MPVPNNKILVFHDSKHESEKKQYWSWPAHGEQRRGEVEIKKKRNKEREIHFIKLSIDFFDVLVILQKLRDDRAVGKCEKFGINLVEFTNLVKENLTDLGGE